MKYMDKKTVKKKLYIIRHGQTAYNLKHIVQVRGIDSSINETRKKQAAAFYTVYRQIPFDKIYISTLKRTLQTIQPFIDDGIAYEKLKGLDEIGWGASEDKELTEDILNDFDRILKAWRNNQLDVKLPDAESPNEVLVRQKPDIDYILAQKDEENVLICTHGRTMRILLCSLTGTPLHKMDEFDHANTALYIVEQKTDSKFEIVDHFNTAHLIDI